MITKEQVLENLEECKKYIQEAENIKEEKVLGIAIKNRFTGDIIFQSTKTTYKEAVEEAIKSKANLSEAYLSGVDLSEANLSGVDLSKAYLSDADLSWANLSKAYLSEANLSGAKLDGCLFYMGNGNRNFEALCKAIKTIRHNDGSFEEITSSK